MAALVGLLAAALWYAASAWIALAGPPMPAVGYLAMGAGIFFSVTIGCGLMALLFYSSRHGYDEPYRDAPYHDAQFHDAPHRDAPHHDAPDHDAPHRRPGTGDDRG